LQGKLVGQAGDGTIEIAVLLEAVTKALFALVRKVAERVTNGRNKGAPRPKLVEVSEGPMSLKFKNNSAFTVLMIAATLIVPAQAFARDQIRAVGSSTVYPFTTAVAEQFGKAAGGKTPVPVDSTTGTGGGIKLFCAGLGEDTPDIANASRPIKKAEFEECVKNGVTDIVEIKIGLDGIVLAHAKSAPDFNVSQENMFMALAEQVPDTETAALVPNKAMTWQDVYPDFPASKIEVLGPPPTSGTRDAFLELMIETGAKGFGSLRDLKDADAKNGTKIYEKIWKSLRKDGAYIDAGENDNLIVQKLEANPNAVGVFGFSFLDQNKTKIKSILVDGIAATYEDIASGKYPGSRSLFIYVKKAHIGVVPGIKEFLAEYVSPKAISADGYLVSKGLIAMPQADLDKAAKTAAELPVMAAPAS
jgi:phosphate transport system substrate-binding protein